MKNNRLYGAGANSSSPRLIHHPLCNYMDIFNQIKVKDRILTEEGKRIGEDRHRFMVEFFNRLNKEVDVIL